MNSSATQSALSLRNLYFVRTLVQLAWAGVLFSSMNHPALMAIMLVAYPLWDVACTLYDLSTQPAADGSKSGRIVNALLGLATALAIRLTITTKPSYSIAAFGAWALIAGLLQLITALIRRREVGGQWAMILSGAQSSIAGITFIAGGLSGRLHPKDLGGYAIFGAVYFAIAGILLVRRFHRASATAQV